MNIADAQRDVRTVFLGGFAGQLVSSCIWFASAAVGSWHSPRLAIIALVAGGFFIFGGGEALLRMMGHASSLPKGHPMNALAMQIAFTLPLNLPLVAAATLHRLNWFYPALMIVLGTHYLPFVFLYGMRQFAALAGILISAGLLIGLYLPNPFALGAWFTGVLLLAFALLGRHAVSREHDKTAAAAIS